MTPRFWEQSVIIHKYARVFRTSIIKNTWTRGKGKPNLWGYRLYPRASMEKFSNVSIFITGEPMVLGPPLWEPPNELYTKQTWQYPPSIIHCAWIQNWKNPTCHRQVGRLLLPGYLSEPRVTWRWAGWLESHLGLGSKGSYLDFGWTPEATQTHQFWKSLEDCVCNAMFVG